MEQVRSSAEIRTQINLVQARSVVAMLTELSRLHIVISTLIYVLANPGGRAAVDLQPLDCWDCGFESR
jgi:hypothetical protein